MTTPELHWPSRCIQYASQGVLNETKYYIIDAKSLDEFDDYLFPMENPTKARRSWNFSKGRNRWAISSRSDDLRRRSDRLRLPAGPWSRRKLPAPIWRTCDSFVNRIWQHQSTQSHWLQNNKTKEIISQDVIEEKVRKSLTRICKSTFHDFGDVIDNLWNVFADASNHVGG